MCMCLYRVKPTWRHGTASALTWPHTLAYCSGVKAVRVGAQSVFQNCVIGDVLICILLQFPCVTDNKRLSYRPSLKKVTSLKSNTWEINIKNQEIKHLSYINTYSLGRSHIANPNSLKQWSMYSVNRRSEHKNKITQKKKTYMTFNERGLLCLFGFL